MNKYLMIMEISQKQAYVFKSKKLSNNIIASKIIRYLTSPEFLTEIGQDIFRESENLVYSGGGHTVLIYNNQENAKELSKRVTTYILEKFQNLEMFVAMKEYSDYPDNGAKNLKELIQKLEIKKSTRKASFHQGKFGIEKISLADKDIVLPEEDRLNRSIKDKRDEELEILISDYEFVKAFEELGGSRNHSDFIAVIHIDGNSMGKKIAIYDEQHGKDNFEQYRIGKKQFSEKIDEVFQKAMCSMVAKVKAWLDEGDGINREKIDVKEGKFPVRKIIASGDDICIVTEGRIGIECAVSFMEALFQQSHEEFSACAGVAIVHKKYPFYKAYDLAEELCSSGKKMIAQVEEGANLCAIDWHIEFGELQGNLRAIREQYKDEDGKLILRRPYLVCGNQKMMEKAVEEPELSFELYKEFKELQVDIQTKLTEGSLGARGKIKSMREAIKKSEKRFDNFCVENRIKDWSKINRRLVFDAIEAMDTYFYL